MNIMMQPGELAKRQSINGGPIKGDDVYQQSILLLKNIIVDYWENTNEEQNPSLDKENISLNANQN